MFDNQSTLLFSSSFANKNEQKTIERFDRRAKLPGVEIGLYTNKKFIDSGKMNWIGLS